jgi:hypothetical protein
LISVLVIPSCGSVSSIRSVINNEPVDIQSYNAVVVNKFTNKTIHKKVNKIVQETFQNTMCNSISESFLFESVYKNKKNTKFFNNIW